MNKTNKGFTLVELLVVIGILGILMGALFPAISAAMLSANSSAMAMKGRNLFVAITQCNTDRTGAGLPLIWPVQNTDGFDEDDKKVAGASSSTDFFNYLFDFENKTSANNWKPYVNCDVGVLSGCGVPGASGSNFDKKNLAWLVLKNYEDSMDDIIPVLVTRNVSRSGLNSVIGSSVQGDETTEVKFGGSDGEDKVPSLDKNAWILVRKSGGTSVVKAKYSKVSVIFNRQGFDNSSMTDKPEILAL